MSSDNRPLSDSTGHIGNNFEHVGGGGEVCPLCGEGSRWWSHGNLTAGQTDTTENIAYASPLASGNEFLLRNKRLGTIKIVANYCMYLLLSLIDTR